MEKLIGDTPDISMFRFHFWEPIEYLDPSVKQPDSGWKKGRTYEGLRSEERRT